MQDRPRPEFAQFRRGFAGADDGIYLDVADRGLISTEVRSAVATFLEACARGDAKDAARSWIAQARQGFAQLVGALPDEIALTKNVSDGINAVATAVDWRPGDNVVLCEELEHPSNLVPWHNLRDRNGVTLRNVEHDNWAIDPERVIGAIDARTRLVTLSMVTFAPGFRADLVSLGTACRSRGVLLLVDAAQTAGVLDIDLSRLPVDALAVGTPKALLGLYGMGFLFVRSDAAERLHPAYLSGQGVDRAATPGADRPVSLKAAAGRFEVGNPNHVGCVAAATSIAQLQAVGTERIEAHAVNLASTLSDGLKEIGLPVLQAPSEQARAHIVAVGSGLEPSLDTTSNEMLRSLHAYLTRHRVRLSVRRGVLRFSVHGYNTHHDIAQTLELARAWRRQARPVESCREPPGR